jgi:hypothetical protein
MKYYIACFCLIGLTFSCQTEPEKSDEGLQDFPAFYERFHEDSTFQLERITFPLQGLPERADSITLARNNFRWSKESWIIQQPFDLSNSEFEQEFLPISDDLIIEKLSHKKWGLAITRRFARLDDGWHLIYYSGLNKVGGDEKRVSEGGGIQIDGGQPVEQ